MRSKVVSLRPKAAIKASEKPVSGAKLLHLLHQEAFRRGHTEQDIAGALEVGLSYYRALRYGQRSIQGLDSRTLELAALYLRVPMINVLLAAGIVRHRDFFDGTVEEIEADIAQAWAIVRADPDVGRYLSDEVDIETRICVGLFYERAHNVNIFKTKIDLRTLTAQLGLSGLVSRSEVTS